jgi:hypothetical protein
VFDIIAHLGPIFEPAQAWSQEIWHEVEADIFLHVPDPSPYGSYQDQLQAYWRTTVANCAPEFAQGDNQNSLQWSQRPADDNGLEYEVFVGRASPRGPDEVEGAHKMTERYRRAMIEALGNRKLFVTKSGYFGVGSRNLQVGDVVTILSATTMPICARKRTSGSEYQMLGAAYLHGIMNGEYIKTMDAAGQLENATVFVFD